MIEDAELLRRYAEDHSEKAFAELVQRHLRLVYSAALRQLSGDGHRAEEVVQTVFTQLARSAGSLNRHPLLAGWLFVSTRHAAAKVVRSEQRRQIREQEAFRMHEITGPTSSDADWDRLHPVLNDVLHELSEADREVVLLRFFEQRAFAEIGATLRVSEDAALKRVDRALDRLRALLADRQITSTTAALSLVLANQPAVAVPAGLTSSVAATAMAVAPGAVAPAAGLLRFAGDMKFALGVGGLALIVVLGVVGYELGAARADGVASAAANNRYNALLARLRGVEQRVQAAEQESTGLRRSVDAARAAQPPAPDPLADGNAFLAAHPAVKRAVANHTRARLNFRWSGLYQALALTPAEIGQFQDLMRELEPGTWSAGIDGEALTIRDGTGMAPGDVETRVRELLGDDGYRKFKEFAQTLPAHEIAAELAGDLYFTDAPITVEQSEQLIQIMTRNRSKENNRPATKFDWDAVMAKAQDVLSSRQLAALGGLHAEDEVTKVMGERLVGPLPPPSGTYMPRK